LREGRGGGRRAFLRLALGLPALALAGCNLPLTLEQGLMGACRDPGLALDDPLVANAWRGLKADRVWDVHTHLFGNGRTGAGIWVDPDYDHPKSPGARVRHAFFVNAACVGKDEDRLDEEMIRRLVRLADATPVGAKFMLLAFECTYDESGKKRPDLTTFCVPNDYARRVATTRPDRFEWIASVHPYRADAIAELERAKAGGARAVKWLPPTMGIDLRAAACVPFYEALKRLDLPLLVHVGEEQAVAGAHRHELANPLFLRAPLERGARVIAAHCATLGESEDLDANANPDKAPRVSNFDLFARMMADREHEGLLFGDLSAITQANRAAVLPKLMQHVPKWEGRLLNGSDYPLPGVLPLFSPKALVTAGLLDEAVVPGLRRLRESHALAFDFVLKRNLRFGGIRLPVTAFETRDYFQNRGHTPVFHPPENRGLSPV
jgi:mannonate dehydratase